MASFISALMGGGGPSTEMTDVAAKESSLANTFMQNYGQLYGEQQGIFNQLKAAYSPLIAAGPGQHGFTSPVLNALNTQAINAAGAANKNAQQAARMYGAGEGGGQFAGGGTSGLTSGIQKQIEAATGTQVANALGAQQNQITQADYNQGRANYFQALGGEQALSGMMNPNATGKLATDQLTSAYDTASNINDEKNAQSAALWGGISSLSNSVLSGGLTGTGGVGNLGGPGTNTSVGENFANFLGV